MDINNLSAFIAVADKKSFSRSAESLKLTQPAVSKRIAALETELNTKLFDRIGRSVHLTEAGRMLLPSARQISAELARIEDVICNLGKEISGRLKLGTSEYIGTHKLPGILIKFRELFPKVEIDVQFAPSERTLSAVEDGTVELALCARTTSNITAIANPKLQTDDIWSDHLVTVAAADHPLHNESTITTDLLSRSPALLPNKQLMTRSAIDEKLATCNLTPTVAVEANDFETLRSMASIGLGWAYLPEFMVDDSLTVLNVRELELEYVVTLARNRERTLSRAAQAFQESLPLALAHS